MPVNTTYPGVYIDEVKSGVRTVTGVPTAIAAFVGYAPRGPVDRPVHITGWADYESVFGGLHSDSPLSYAVYQFYMNGGSEAEIVRVVGEAVPVALPIGGSQRATGGAPASPAPAPEPDPGEGAPEPPAAAHPRKTPGLLAASPGSWALNLRARVDHDTSESEDPKLPLSKRKLYNLTIRDTGTGAEERYLNVNIDSDSPRSLAHVLATSRLVKVDPENPVVGLPPENDKPKTPGADPFADPEKSDEGKARECFTAPPQGGTHADSMPTLDSYLHAENDKTGLYHLLKTDIFNLLCLPGCYDHLGSQDAVKTLQDRALELCLARRAILLVDPPSEWTPGPGGSSLSIDVVTNNTAPSLPSGESTKNAALYFPRIIAPDPLRQGATRAFPPCGVMAGVLARTDVQRGVWKAAAGTDASLNGVSELEVPLTDLENGRLNPLGINCLRRLPAVGPVAWGARTMRGADRLADEWKYLPVRRLALFVEESLFRGTQWVVFEPNDEPLWASIRLNVGAFMNSLFRAGAFQGRTPQEAYLVKCDRENNPQNDIDRGIVNVQVSFAPLKPAEFVIVHIQQLAGQIQV
ncbi:phage tail sheath C-terminal domain-containing protein [Streptomyces sp. NPDC056696]|uniref:phage tail sheath family protein n=1 Tax=unclassified Streptomyces TaxID=2593676 RepID=UPI000E3056BF|nr:phage tail sheath C-terminal domain-containing protein [Streptomyces sp. AcE210]RFC71012.1 phage tail sheath family protein [Streptomyces sp. AcE210]